jgi:hypothetical protein
LGAAFTQAAQRGYVEIMEWLYSQGVVCSNEDIILAAQCSQKDLYDWARRKGHNWDDVLLQTAVRTGDVELIKWGLANGCAWTKQQLKKTIREYSNLHPGLKSLLKKRNADCIVS